MKKPKRRKVQREWLENQLFKIERRIQKLAENAYYFRQAIETMDRQEVERNRSKGVEVDTEVVEAAVQTKVEEKDYAVCGTETSDFIGETGDNAGEGGGFVRPSVHSDVTEVASESQLDNVEPNS